MVDMRVASAKKRREARTSGGSSSSSKSSSSGNKSTSTSKSTVPKFESFAKQPLPQSKAVPDFASFGKQPLPQSQAPTSQRTQSRSTGNVISAGSSTPTGSSKLSQFGDKAKEIGAGFANDMQRFLTSDESNEYKIANAKAAEFGFESLTPDEKEALVVRFNTELPGSGLAARVEAATAPSTKVAFKKLTDGYLRNLEIGQPLASIPVAGKSVLSQVNSKVIKNINKQLSNKFTQKALAFGGAWAGAVFLGKWAQAEATEPLAIINKWLVPNALETGDWSLVDEATDAKNELLDLSFWEKVGLWSPISPAIGIPKKIEGAIKASEIQDRVLKSIREQSETGESDTEFYARIDQERAEEKEQARINDEEYYANIAKQQADAKAQERTDDEAYWAKILTDRETAAAKKQKEEDEYWTAYWKQINDSKSNKGSAYKSSYEAPSKLNFGIL